MEQFRHSPETRTGDTPATLPEPLTSAEEALVGAMKTYALGPDDFTERGRIAKEISDQLVAYGAKEYAVPFRTEAEHLLPPGAFEELATIPKPTTREEYREQAAVALHTGITALHTAVQIRRQGQFISKPDPLYSLRTAWGDISLAKQQASGLNKHVDQKEIVAAPYVSVAESLLGHRRRGLAIGARAVALAFMSESPKLDTSKPNLSFGRRLRSKAKTFIGGIAAVGVGVLAEPRISRLKDSAWALADRML